MDTKHNEIAIRGLQAHNKHLEDEIERLEKEVVFCENIETGLRMQLAGLEQAALEREDEDV